MRPREPFSRRLRRTPGVLVAGALVALVAAFVVLMPSGSRSRAPRAPDLPPPPKVVIGRHAPAASRPAVSPQELARARRVAQRFLSGYLPFLYGRARPRAVNEVTGGVRAALTRGRARVTPTQHRRRPALSGLTLVGRAHDRVDVTARVSDGGPAPYPITFTLTRHGGGWIVSDLGGD